MKLKILPSPILLFFFLLDVCSTFGALAGIKTIPGDCTSVSAGDNDQLSAPLGTPNPQMITSLYGVNSDESIYMADGAIIIYNDSYSNDVDAMDGVKLSNSSENLAIKTDNTLLVVERRHTIAGIDTTFLNLTNMLPRKYRFDFQISQLVQPGLSGFLEDNWLHTCTQLGLNGSNTIDFDVTNVPASFAPDRFRIIFSSFSSLPVTLTSIKARPKNKNVIVEWQAINESNLIKYDVQKSIDGNSYITVNTLIPNNSMMSNYNWLDMHPSEGNNFYRILSTDIDGKINYSKVAKVSMGEKQTISIYPNPVINGIINLQLTNQAAGVYAIRLFNQSGQVLFSKQINHVAGYNTATFDIGKNSTHGAYLLEITKPGGNKVNLQAIY